MLSILYEAVLIVLLKFLVQFKLPSKSSDVIVPSPLVIMIDSFIDRSEAGPATFSWILSLTFFCQITVLDRISY